MFLIRPPQELNAAGAFLQNQNLKNAHVLQVRLSFSEPNLAKIPAHNRVPMEVYFLIIK